jgi:cell division protein FtsX
MLRFGAVVLCGLAVDWALYSRLAGVLAQHYSQSNGYLTFLFLRVLLTVLSLFLIGYLVSAEYRNSVLTIFGAVLFAGSNFYAVYRFYRGDEIRD